MEEELSNFELDILDRIAMDHPFLQSHIPLLRVSSREITGVGMYVNFTYLNTDDNYQPIPSAYIALSTDSHLQMEGLQYGLAYEVTIEKGKLEFLEIVTYGEDWDGNIRKYSFE